MVTIYQSLSAPEHNEAIKEKNFRYVSAATKP